MGRRDELRGGEERIGDGEEGGGVAGETHPVRLIIEADGVPYGVAELAAHLQRGQPKDGGVISRGEPRGSGRCATGCRRG